MKPPETRPERLLREMTGQYPGAWEYLEYCRRNQGTSRIRAVWPDWCYCPMDAAGSYVMQSLAGDNGVRPNLSDMSPLDVVSVTVSLQRIAALGAWRMGRGLYRFDADLAAALINTSLDGRIPVELLYRLPEWCVYVEAPPGWAWADEVYGFFAFLNYVHKTGRSELRITWDTREVGLVGVPLYMHHDTIEAMVAEGLDTSRLRAQGLGLPADLVLTPKEVQQDLPTSDALNLLLYLCNAEADYRGDERPHRPEPVKTKHGVKTFPAASVRVWEVGNAVGDRLRAARKTEQQQPEERHAPRPHLRRAHWHTYRVGEGRQGVRVRWLHPILVGHGGE